REVRDARTRGAELVAVLGVVPLEPAGTDAQDQPTTADVVDGARHVGQEVGVAAGVARHERTDLDAARLLGPRAEHRPALEVLAVGVAEQREDIELVASPLISSTPCPSRPRLRATSASRRHSTTTRPPCSASAPRPT